MASDLLPVLCRLPNGLMSLRRRHLGQLLAQRLLQELAGSVTGVDGEALGFQAGLASQAEPQQEPAEM